jgi:hypothetical protein
VQWQRWLDSFCPRLIERWTSCKGCPVKTASVTVTLSANSKPTNGVKYSPEESPAGRSFSEIVQDVTGLSSGKELHEILPTECKNAKAMYLYLTFEELNPF